MSYKFLNIGDALKATSNVTVRSLAVGPVSIAQWFKPQSMSNNAILSLLAILTASSKHFSARAWWSTTSRISAWNNDQSAQREQMFDSSTTISNAWHHCAICWPAAGTSTPLVWYDGAPRSPLTPGASGSPAAFSVDGITWTLSTATAIIWAAWGGIWNDQLTDADVTNLFTNKYSPKLVKPSTLQHCWTLRQGDGATNGRDDIQGTAHLTSVTGATSDSPDPGDSGGAMVESLGGSRGLISTTPNSLIIS